MKGHIYGGDRPVDETRIANFVADAVATGTNEENFLQPLRQVVAIFRYMFDDDVLPQIQRERRQIRRQLAAIATWIPQLQPLLSIWTEFDPAYFAFYAENTRTWLQGQIILIRNQYNAANPVPANRARVLQELLLLENQLGDIVGFPDPGPDEPGD